MSDAVIEVNGLKKTFSDGFLGLKKVPALRGVTFEVPRGEIFGLLGPNGAGKTTLIKILLGIVRKSGGSASVLGYSAGTRRSRVRVGYLPEGHRLPRHLTGYTALEYYGGLSGLSAGEVRRRRGAILEEVDLAKWGNTSVRKYSKGMQQRIGLAQAMLHDPDLLILDEPTDGVDPVGRAKIREVLNRWRDQGKTVFLNSHLLQEIELVCDRVAILVKGELKIVDDVASISRRVGADQLNEVRFSLQGSKADIEAAFAGTTATVTPAEKSAGFNVQARLATQKEIDACLDDLRRRGISIRSMVPHQLSLEEAFLKLVRTGTAPKEADIFE